MTKTNGSLKWDRNNLGNKVRITKLTLQQSLLISQGLTNFSARVVPRYVRHSFSYYVNGKLKFCITYDQAFSLEFHIFLVVDFFSKWKFFIITLKEMHALSKRSNSVQVKRIFIFILPIFSSTPHRRWQVIIIYYIPLQIYTCIHVCVCMYSHNTYKYMFMHFNLLLPIIFYLKENLHYIFGNMEFFYQYAIVFMSHIFSTAHSFYFL